MEFVLGIVIGSFLGVIASDEVKAVYFKIRNVLNKKI